MNNEKKTWLLEQYAHKAWTISLTLAQEAARAGQHGEGYAVTAGEARLLADKLFDYTAKLRFDGEDGCLYEGIADFAVMMKFLAVNAAFEIWRMADISMDFNIPKSMAVFAEELRRLSAELAGLAGFGAQKNAFIMPELLSPSASEAVDSFFIYSIGGHPLIENLKNILEVLYIGKTDAKGKAITLRGLEIPVIDCGRLLNVQLTDMTPDMQTVMVIRCKSDDGDGLFAVPIDGLDMAEIFYSRIGRSVLPKAAHAFAGHSRECWDTTDGRQLLFTDWKKLVSEIKQR